MRKTEIALKKAEIKNLKKELTKLQKEVDEANSEYENEIRALASKRRIMQMFLDDGLRLLKTDFNSAGNKLRITAEFERIPKQG